MSAVIFSACAAVGWLFIQSLKKMAASGRISQEFLILFYLLNGEQAEQSELVWSSARGSIALLSFSNHYLLFVNLCFMKIHDMIYHINQRLYPLFTDVSELKTFGKETGYEKDKKRKYITLCGVRGKN